MAYISVPRATCLVVAPPDPAGRLFVSEVKLMLASSHVRVISADEVRFGPAAQDRFVGAVDESDVVIADVTRTNANVLLEMGIAMGRGVPLLPVVRAGTTAKIPSEIAEMHYLVFDPKKLSEFARYVRDYVLELASSSRGGRHA